MHPLLLIDHLFRLHILIYLPFSGQDEQRQNNDGTFKDGKKYFEWLDED